MHSRRPSVYFKDGNLIVAAEEKDLKLNMQPGFH